MDRHRNLTTQQKKGGVFRRSAWWVLHAVLLVSVAFTAMAQSPTPSQLTITVSSTGISPATATVKAGVTRLTVENQRVLDRVTLRLSNQNGELVREIALPDKASVWQTELELGVGQYVISDTSNSAWSCRITVQAPEGSE